MISFTIHKNAMFWILLQISVRFVMYSVRRFYHVCVFFGRAGASHELTPLWIAQPCSKGQRSRNLMNIYGEIRNIQTYITVNWTTENCKRIDLYTYTNIDWFGKRPACGTNYENINGFIIFWVHSIKCRRCCLLFS